jgi:hypothetical protein
MKAPRLSPINQLQALILFFTGVILYCEKFHSADGQLFQVFAGILTGLTGVLIGYGKQQLGVHDDEPLPPGSKRVTAGSITEEAAPAPEAPEEKRK